MRDLANEAYSLGRPMSNEDLVRKTLRSLSPRYKMKAIAIEEMQDLKTLRFDELIGSLMTFELSLPAPVKKEKGLALKSTMSHLQNQEDSESDEDSDEALALMVKNYNRIMKRFSRRSGKYTPQLAKDIENNMSPQDVATPKGKGI